MKSKSVEFAILRIMIALSVIITVTAEVSSPSVPSPFAAPPPPSSIALAFHIVTQTDNISQAQRAAQDVDRHLNNTRQAIQNGNTTGALFFLGQAQQQLSFLKSGNLTTTPPIIDPLQTDLFLGTTPGSSQQQQQPIPSIAPPPPPPAQTSPPSPPPPVAQQQQQEQQTPQEPLEQQLPDEPIVTPPTVPSPPAESLAP